MFELARELHITVGWLKSNMSAYELSQWIAFYKMQSEEREGKKKPTREAFKGIFRDKIKKVKGNDDSIA